MTNTPDLTSQDQINKSIGMCRLHGLHNTEATLRALSAALEAEKAESVKFRKGWSLAVDQCDKEYARADMCASSNVREWFHYPIEIPLTTEGNGPAKVGVDAVQISYEVWDRLLNTHATFDNLPDAINEAMRLNSTRAELCDPLQDERVKALAALLREAREDVAGYVNADYPEISRATYPDIQRRWHRDMELCRRIDAALRDIGVK